MCIVALCLVAIPTSCKRRVELESMAAWASSGPLDPRTFQLPPKAELARHRGTCPWYSTARVNDVPAS